MINNVVLVGRAGSNPELRHFNSGAKVCELRMAINRVTKKGEDQITDWFTIKIWGDAAGVAGEYIKKGHLFGIVGELQEEKWEKDGEKRSKIIVVAQRLKLMEPKAKGEQEQESSSESDDYDPFA